jgi:hypothetical protein
MIQSIDDAYQQVLNEMPDEIVDEIHQESYIGIRISEKIESYAFALYYSSRPEEEIIEAVKQRIISYYNEMKKL